MEATKMFDDSILGVLVDLWNIIYSTASSVIEFMYTEITIPVIGTHSVMGLMFGAGLIVYLLYKLLQAFTPL